jgi:phosphatidylinositol alpha-mannosyltransferase
MVLSPGEKEESVKDGVVFRGLGRVREVAGNGSIAPLCLSPFAAYRARKIAKSFGAEIVHLHEPLAPLLGYGILFSPISPTVATFHRFGEPGIERRLRFVFRPFLNRLGASVAVSQAAKESAQRSIGGNYEVLFNGVEVGATAIAAKDTSPVEVLFVGRHEPRKGLSLFLEAFTEALVSGAIEAGTARAVIVGDGPTRLALESRFPTSPTYRWCGRVSDVELANLYNHANILAAPSLGGESFGVILLEAIAAKMVVVASEITGYSEAIGGHGVLVPPGTKSAWAKAIALAVKSCRDGFGVASKEMVTAAYNYAQSRSLSRLTQEYESIYWALTTKRQSP